MPSTLMAIAAHPGDTFFTMGGAIAAHVRQGGRGIFLSLTLGEKGNPSLAPEKYGELQRESSDRAAKMLGAENVLLTYPDAELPANDEVSLAVCDLIRKYKPTTVITHWSGSWHKDHQACHAVVRDAIFYAGLRALSRSEPSHTVNRLYFAENWEDMTNFQPDTYLDVTAAYDAWLAACEAFPMWRGETGFRYNDYYRSLAVMRGCLGGFRYAVALMSSAEQREQRVKSIVF